MDGRKNILLVEDNKINAIDQIMQLEERGYDIIHTINGEEAVNLVRSNEIPVDLVLMDIELGRGLDGTEAAREILEIRNIPVIFLSSHTEEEIVEKTEKITSYGYVVKNSGITILDTSIKKAFKLHAAFCELLEQKQKTQESSNIINCSPAVPFLWMNKPDWPVEYVSENVFDLTGYLTEDFVSGKVEYSKIIHRDDLKRVANEVTWHSSTGVESFEHKPYRIITKTGNVKWVEDKTFIRRDKDGDITHYQGIVMDITRRKKIEDALDKTMSNLESIIENHNESIWSVDKDLNYIIFNDFYRREVFKNCNIELTSGMNALDIIPSEHKQFWRSKYKSALNGKKVSFELSPKVGNCMKFSQISLNPILSEDRITGVSVICVDTTAQKKAELKIRKEMARSQQYLDIVGVMFVAIDRDGRTTLVNKRLCEIIGYREEEIIGKNWFDLVIPERLKKEIKSISTKLLKGEIDPIEYYENPLITKSGEERIIAWHNSMLLDDKGGIIGHLSSGEDVTEHRIMEESLRESEELYRNVFNNSHSVMLIIDPENADIVDANPAAQSFYGWSHEELTNKKITDINILVDNQVFEKMKLAKTEEHQHFIFRHRLRTKDIRDVEVYSGPIVLHSKKLLYSIIHDITDRVNAEQKVQDLLQEKELLLKEVHHRIKNNMNTVMSLLSLQAGTLKNTETVTALNNAASRIHSMMVLYDKLYLSNSFQDVSIKEYLEALVTQIVNNFPNPERIKIEMDIDDFILNPKMIFNLGILINELITNTMKYAFDVKESGTITVSASITGCHVTIIIQDNGRGIPQAIDIETSTGFGFTLVKILTSQLNGRIELIRSEGTKFILDFDT